MRLTDARIRLVERARALADDRTQLEKTYIANIADIDERLAAAAKVLAVLDDPTQSKLLDALLTALDAAGATVMIS